MAKPGGRCKCRKSKKGEKREKNKKITWKFLECVVVFFQETRYGWVTTVIPC